MLRSEERHHVPLAGDRQADQVTKLLPQLAEHLVQPRLHSKIYTYQYN